MYNQDELKGMKEAQNIADYILAISCPECGDIISNLKLQKLLYYCQGVHLAIHDTPLFSDEIVAWEHGPVVPNVYHNFKQFGGGAIEVPEEYSGPELTEEESGIVDEVYDVFGQFSAWKLRDMTHEETPWKATSQNEVIDTDLIKTYFRENIVEA